MNQRHGPPRLYDRKTGIICRKCKMPGHIYRHCPWVKCFRCQFFGHISQNCPLNRLLPTASCSVSLDTDSLQPPSLPVQESVQYSDLRGEEAVNRVVDTISKVFSSAQDCERNKQDSECKETRTRVEDALPRGSFQVFRDKKFKFSSSECKTKVCGLGNPPRKRRKRNSGTCEQDTFTERGDFDALIVLQQHGCLLFEIKATGDEDRRMESIKCVVRRATERLEKGQRAMQHLQLPGAASLHVVTALALPNLSRQLLKDTFQQDPELREHLTRCMFPTCASPSDVDVEAACLCSDDLPPKDGLVDPADPRVVDAISRWWGSVLQIAGPTQEMGQCLYDSVIASLSTGEDEKSLPQHIHGAMLKHKKLQFFSEKQTEIVHSTENYVFITGPPGSGKSLVLAQKAVTWLHDNEKVVLVHKYGITTTQPASVFLLDFVHQILDSDEKCTGLFQLGIDDNKEVLEFIENEVLGRVLKTARSSSRSVQLPLNQGQGLNFIIDEISKRTQTEGKLFELISEIKERVPKARIWCAGLFLSHSPEEFTVKKLDRSYRCPVKIQRLLKALEQFPQKDSDSNVFEYSTSNTDVSDGSSQRRLRLPKSKADLHFLSHQGHGHGEIWDCSTCSEDLVLYLKSLLSVTGLPESTDELLQQTDVLLVATGTKLYTHLDDIQTSTLYHRLTAEGSGVNFTVNIVKHSDNLDLGGARSGMPLMHVRTVGGMEAGLVVFLPCRRYQQSTAEARKLRLCDCVTQDQRQRLTSLGHLNRHWLWYAASRSLSHLVVCHF